MEHRFAATDNRRSNRIRLTRTRAALKGSAGDRLILIESDHVMDQLRQVIFTLGVTPEDIRPFSRCIECNSPLVSINKDRIRTRVPDYIWHTTETFKQCRQCAKIYWPGSHTRNTMDAVRRLFAEQPPA